MFGNKRKETEKEKYAKENELGERAEDFLLTSLTYNLGFVKGFSDTKKINYCPQCGKKRLMYQREGIMRCDKCKVSFAVVQVK